MSTLTGGIAPAFAKPGDHGDPVIPVVPTTEVVAPEAPQVVPEERAPVELPRAPKEPPSPPKVDSPPQQALVPEIQAPAPEPQAPAPQIQAPAPQIAAPPPPPKEEPRVVEAPKVEAPKVEAPKVDAPKVVAPQVEAPKVNAPSVDAPKADAPKVVAPQVDAPKADAPKVDAPKVEAPKVDVPKADTPAPPAAVDQPAKPADPAQQGSVAEVPKNLAPGSPSDPGANGSDKKLPPAAEEVKPGTDGLRDATGDEAKTDPSTASKPSQQIAIAQPDTLEAPEQDIQLAKQSKPIEVKPDPAPKQDVDFLSSTLDISSKTKLGPFESEFNVGSEFSVGGDRDRDREHDWDWDNKHWDKKVRQWDRKWIEYDDWYRPVFCNPFRAPVRIVYIYQYAPRILIIPPLARVLVDAVELAAYSFTAVVLNAANLAADVAVGTFFGGGLLPGVGVPFVPPPPLLRYDNVPVQVRYSNATYEPFRVRQIVDVGDDVRYGGRKVLLDGATPAWGQWTTSPTGERQFEVHRTQQYPGLGDPQEAPLPGDYRMQLASDEGSGIDHTQMYLMAAAGVIAGLGFGALGLAFYLGRRRQQL